MIIKMMGIWLVVTLLLPGVAQATILYSVNATTDRLVTLDTNTRAITDVGALGIDIGGTDGLAFTDANNLYATFSTGGSYDFYRINPTTGNATLVKGNYVNGSEGMASRSSDGALFISYGLVTPGGNSDRLGKVNPVDGTVTDIGLIGQDTDAISFRADGTLFGEDVTVSATPAQSLFYTINPADGTKAILGGAFATDYNLNGMVFGNDGVLYGVMNDVQGTGSYLAEITIGAGTPTITTSGFLSADSLGDLAARPSSTPPTPAPAPATLALLGLGLAGIGFRRRKTA